VSVELIISITFLLLLLLLFIRVPIFLGLAVAGVVGIYLCRGMVGLSQAPLSMIGQLANFTLVAVPLYILLGEIIFTTGIGPDLFEAAHRWLYRVPGSLAVASIFAAAVFGAMCGVSIAGVAVIGVIAVPEMLKRRYDPALAAGSVTASGALAMLIPPSLLFILYSSVSKVSVGQLFIGGIIPGVFLAVLMAIYVMVRVKLNPSLAPVPDERFSWQDRVVILKRLWPPLTLILLILGSIYTGFCTPTEAAAIGCVGAFIVAHFAYHSMRWPTVKRIFNASARTSGSILIILACAFIFSQFLVYTRVPDLVSEFCTTLPWPPVAVILMIMLIYVLLGMFIDAASITIVSTPIFLPTIVALGYDPLWFGILLVMNMEMAVITPPVGLNLYTMKSIIPELTLEQILRGALPYVFIEFAALLPFIFFPELALWLPRLMK
jgi:tripartite ATP-independent transporter DctM subunit